MKENVYKIRTFRPQETQCLERALKAGSSTSWQLQTQFGPPKGSSSSGMLIVSYPSSPSIGGSGDNS